MSKRLGDLKPEEHIKVLIYGDSGSGKTCFSCSFPGPIYVADFDNKVSSAASYYRDTDKLSEIEYDSYLPDEKMPGKSANDFYEKIKEFHGDVKAGKLRFKTVVLDSFTTFNDEAMARIMRTNPGIKRNPPTTPALQDYGILRLELKRVIGHLLSLPCNVIVTAHIETKKDEATGRILRQPMLTGKLAGELPIYFGEVYRSYVDSKNGERQHLAQTQSDREFSCRSQIKGLPATIPLRYESLLCQQGPSAQN